MYPTNKPSPEVRCRIPINCYLKTLVSEPGRKKGFKQRTIQAHEGDFTALSYGTQYVVTGGTQDAILKVWSPSLDQCLMQASAVTGILSLGWAGPDTLLTVYRDGSAQTWQVGDRLCAGLRHPGLDLRCVTGLPVEQMARSCAGMERQWRDAKVAEAKELLAQPEQTGRLAALVRDLRERGFSAEAVLVLADAARSQQQPLWELESLLALAKGWGDSSASVPCLYALAVLLENMKEYQLALQHFERIRQIAEGYRDIDHHISPLTASPLLTLSPDSCVRGDLMHPSRVRPELRKNTILERKFYSRTLIRAGNPMHCPSAIEVQKVQEAVAEALQQGGVGSQHAGLQQVMVLGGNGPQEITWVYAPATAEPHGAAFAMAVRTLGTGMRWPTACLPTTSFTAPSSLMRSDAWQTGLHIGQM